MDEHSLKVTVPEEFDGERIDRFLAVSLEADFSRSYIQKLIKGQHILVNYEEIKANHKVHTDDEISIRIPEPTALEMVPRDLPLDILYEDSHIAVINKAPGMIVHPGHGNQDETLVHALLFHLDDLSGIGGVERPGIVHRLDRDTSGLMVIAKSDLAHKHLVEEFSNRTVTKVYDAIVVGKPLKDREMIDAPIGRHKVYRQKMTITPDGREARTEYRIEKIWHTTEGVFSHLRVRIYTGRTHQIRVHLSAHGYPIVGDQVYSKKWEKHRVPYLLLAATRLSFHHPEDGREMNFTIPMPQHMMDFIKRIEGRSV